jgi:hypothetical protein
MGFEDSVNLDKEAQDPGGNYPAPCSKANSSPAGSTAACRRRARLCIINVYQPLADPTSWCIETAAGWTTHLPSWLLAANSRPERGRADPSSGGAARLAATAGCRHPSLTN